MSFTILPATAADLPEIIAISAAAFKTDRIISQLMPNVQPEAKKAYDLQWYQRELDMSSLNGLRFYKAVDERGKVVGSAKWQYPHVLSSEQAEEKTKLDELKDSLFPLPEGSNEELYKTFFGPLHEKQRKYIEKGKDYYLHVLAVDPSYHRRGIGSLLIRRGLEDADRDGARTYIEASPAGLPLYLKFGWKEIDKVVVDIGEIDGRGFATEVCLMRAAKAG